MGFQRRRIGLSKVTFSLSAVALVLAFYLPGFAQDAKPAAIFAVMGDTGSGDEAQLSVARQMVKQRAGLPFDFTIMLGDNIYEKGEERLVKPRFEDPYRELLDGGVKFYAALGNHDIIKGLEFQTNYKNFNMGGRRYYNFTRGTAGAAKDAAPLIEFFALDTNVMSNEQVQWLEEKLKASKAKWKVAFCHHSIYSSARMHSPYVKLRALLEPLYIKYGVNAVFAGHSHCYERVKTQQGVEYFTVGSSGEIKRGTLDGKSPLTAVGNDKVNIFMIVTASDNEMSIKAIAADGATIDEYTIKPRG